MTVHISSKTCEQVLAILIACTRRKTRPLSLVAVADNLNAAIQCFGTVETVATKIGLSSSMLRRFLLVNRLEPTLTTLVANRQIDTIDSVAELASLSEKAQRELAEVLPNENFNTEDIRGCVRLLNHDPRTPISEVIKKVRESKTIRVFVYEFVITESTRDEDVVKCNSLKLLSNDELAGVEHGAAIGRLKVYKPGRTKISNRAKANKTSTQNFVQLLCEGGVQ